jgi:hypothetical protein
MISNTATIYYCGDTLYLKKIDSTHLYISTIKDELGIIYHVGQLSHRPYYEDLLKWLGGTLNINHIQYMDD